MIEVEIEIDGQKLKVESGKMIIEVADEAGIPIPRFCYHKKLSIAANCRMCLVEVEKAPKPLPACATPITEGMIVRTQSALALDAQRSVMEFLLINHPLDCPICDQGGECELQDVAMGYGRDLSRFTEGKRSVADEDLGSLVATDMTRCIQCTRCVRFGQEIIGAPELGTMGRGEHMEISTYIEESLRSEISGNIIDLCPVGALTSKPFRYQARAWEMEQEKSIAAHDCVGSNLYLQRRRDIVLRAAPRENESINETWLSDRDRFSYLGFLHPERVGSPLIKENGVWKEVDWQFALNVAADGLQKITADQGGARTGAIISPNATTEEMYLLQKFMRGIGSHNIDHRLQQTDVSDQKEMHTYPGMHLSIAEIENSPSILLIGSHVSREQPIIAHRIRQAALQGSAIFAINPIDYRFNFTLAGKKVVKPGYLLHTLMQVAKALSGKAAEFDDINIDESSRELAEGLAAFKRGYIFLGALAQNHPQAAAIRYYAELIANLTEAKVILLTPGANSAGAWLSGAIPHRGAAQKTIAAPGLSVKQMFDEALPAYILFNIEPELDCMYGSSALASLNKADLVIVMTPYMTDTMKTYADIILPIVPVSETSGTFVNVEGKWQSFKGSVKPFAQARPGWKVLRVLGNLMHLPDFEYESTEQIHDELKEMVDGMMGGYQKPLEVPAKYHHGAHDDIEVIIEWPIYRTDNVVRRSQALQDSALGEIPCVFMHPEMAAKLQVTSGDEVTLSSQDKEAALLVALDDNILAGCIYLPAGFNETSLFTDPTAKIKIARSQIE